MNTLQCIRRLSMMLAGMLVSLFALTSNVSAAAYSSVTVYGDSLSDNGNLFAATGLPGDPYYAGRRSNGKVAVEYLAASLGAPLVDFAWIGATTGIGNYADDGTVTSPGFASLPGMLAMYATTAPSLATSVGAVDPSYLTSGLFVVWGGPNDWLAPSPLDLTPDAIIGRAVANELGIVSGLLSLGVSNILVPGMPDLGLTPYFSGLGPSIAADATAFADIFNAQLEGALAALSPDIVFYDTAALFRSVVANPAAYGFSNVSDYCFDLAPCDGYLFFDDFHPTTAAHALLASEFARAVPEPATLTLCVFAILLLGFSRRYGLAARSLSRSC